MKKDIFNILKHANKHKLEIIETDTSYLLGCVTCGETIFNSESDQDIKDCVEAFNICKKAEKTSLCHILLQYLFIACDIEYQLYELIMRSVDNNENGYNHVCLREVFFLEKTKMLMDLNIDLNSHLLYMVKKLFKDEQCKGKIILYPGEKYVISNEIIIGKDYNKSNNCNVTIINLDKTLELEQNNPTAKDILIINDSSDLDDITPNWDDEDEQNNKYNEFIFRFENGLINFDSLTKEQLVSILSDKLDYYFDYDYTNRIRVVIIKILQDLGINIERK